MEAADKLLRRQKSKRSRGLLIGGVVAVVVLLAIIIPLAVILPKKGHPKGQKATAIVPLYIYPKPDAWNPLYEALDANPSLNFTVVVNPNSGPGDSAYPSDEYTTQILKLNKYPNVQTVGYVRTTYATRNVSDVLADVATYSGWATNATTKKATGLAMHGIFFDEAVYDYTAEAAEFMKTINQAAKNAVGLASKTIIHNPGVIPDARLDQDNTDVTVVFEASYDTYKTRQSKLSALSEDRSHYSYMVHSVPTSMSISDMKDFVAKISEKAEYLFLTDLSQDYYESWGPRWLNFTSAIPT